MPALLPHESAAHVFNEIFLDAIQPTGLKYSLQLLGSTTFCGPNGAKTSWFLVFAAMAPTEIKGVAECGD